MSKNVFCVALCAVLFALSFSASAQQPGKLPKIGWLSPGSAATTRIELFLREFVNLAMLRVRT
jgi:hypothetical protein